MITYHSERRGHYISKIRHEGNFYLYDGMKVDHDRFKVCANQPVPEFNPAALVYIKLT